MKNKIKKAKEEELALRGTQRGVSYNTEETNKKTLMEYNRMIKKIQDLEEEINRYGYLKRVLLNGLAKTKEDFYKHIKKMPRLIIKNGVIEIFGSIRKDVPVRVNGGYAEAYLYLEKTQGIQEVRTLAKEAYQTGTLKDNAMRTNDGNVFLEITDRAVGGIDFDSALLNLQIKRDGRGVPLPLEFQRVGDMHIEGFRAVILEVAPVSLPQLFGLADI